MRTLIGRGVDHQQEALLGGRELRDVVIRVRTSDMLLHRAVALFLWTSMVRSGEYSGLSFAKLEARACQAPSHFLRWSMMGWGS